MTTHPVHALQLASLFHTRDVSSRRASSWDRSGANADFLQIAAGETVALLQQDGAGCITHLYCAFALPDLRDYRNAILRCYWDGADNPSVEVPLGDFFGLAHARAREFSSQMLSVNGGSGSSQGLNAYFPMPFNDGALITLENRGDTQLGGAIGAFWYHVEYETYSQPIPDDVDRFHASWRQETPTTAVGPEQNLTLHDAKNLTGEENYVAVDTVGQGRMVGLVLEIDNVQGRRWYGEGDDMVFIDGDSWPPAIHGTGTEEIFGGGACPATEYAGINSGFHLVESPRFDGLIGMYRWYVNDPIHFGRSLRWTLEHGHANNFSNNYSSIVYWYQSPLGQLPALPAASDMLPRLEPPYQEAYDLLLETIRAERANPEDPETMAKFFEISDASAPLYRGDFVDALDRLQRLQGSAR